MSTLQTFFRAVVMIITIGILAKAWYHYGPTTDELQVMGSRAFQLALEAWDDYWRTPTAQPALAGGPAPNALTSPTSPAPFLPPAIEPPPIHTPGAVPAGPVQFAGGTLPPSAPELSSMPGGPAAEAASPGVGPPFGASPPALVPMEAPVADARVDQMLEQLAAIGVREPELKPWGNSGNLYRFTCSAPWVNSPSFSRHFEAVAESPAAAVERVATDIHEWQRGQR